MNSDFADIKLVDLDVEMTRPSDRASGLRHMFLKLSSYPPAEWVQIFNGERNFPRHSMWRRAWIEGQHAVVDCVPEEVEQCHLLDIKEDVATSNRKYREYITKVQAEKERQINAANAEQEALKNLKDKLGFD